MEQSLKMKENELQESEVINKENTKKIETENIKKMENYSKEINQLQQEKNYLQSKISCYIKNFINFKEKFTKQLKSIVPIQKDYEIFRDNIGKQLNIQKEENKILQEKLTTEITLFLKQTKENKEKMQKKIDSAQNLAENLKKTHKLEFKKLLEENNRLTKENQDNSLNFEVENKRFVFEKNNFTSEIKKKQQEIEKILYEMSELKKGKENLRKEILNEKNQRNNERNQLKTEKNSLLLENNQKKQEFLKQTNEKLSISDQTIKNLQEKIEKLSTIIRNQDKALNLKDSMIINLEIDLEKFKKEVNELQKNKLPINECLNMNSNQEEKTNNNLLQIPNEESAILESNWGIDDEDILLNMNTENKKLDSIEKNKQKSPSTKKTQIEVDKNNDLKDYNSKNKIINSIQQELNLNENENNDSSPKKANLNLINNNIKENESVNDKKQKEEIINFFENLNEKSIEKTEKEKKSSKNFNDSNTTSPLKNKETIERNVQFQELNEINEHSLILMSSPKELIIKTENKLDVSSQAFSPNKSQKKEHSINKSPIKFSPNQKTSQKEEKDQEILNKSNSPLKQKLEEEFYESLKTLDKLREPLNKSEIQETSHENLKNLSPVKPDIDPPEIIFSNNSTPKKQALKLEKLHSEEKKEIHEKLSLKPYENNENFIHSNEIESKFVQPFQENISEQIQQEILGETYIDEIPKKNAEKKESPARNLNDQTIKKNDTDLEKRESPTKKSNNQILTKHENFLEINKKNLNFQKSESPVKTSPNKINLSNEINLEENLILSPEKIESSQKNQELNFENNRTSNPEKNESPIKNSKNLISKNTENFNFEPYEIKTDIYNFTQDQNFSPKIEKMGEPIHSKQPLTFFPLKSSQPIKNLEISNFSHESPNLKNSKISSKSSENEKRLENIIGIMSSPSQKKEDPEKALPLELSDIKEPVNNNISDFLLEKQQEEDNMNQSKNIGDKNSGKTSPQKKEVKDSEANNEENFDQLNDFLLRDPFEQEQPTPNITSKEILQPQPHSSKQQRSDQKAEIIKEVEEENLWVLDDMIDLKSLTKPEVRIVESGQNLDMQFENNMARALELSKDMSTNNDNFKTPFFDIYSNSNINKQEENLFDELKFGKCEISKMASSMEKSDMKNSKESFFDLGSSFNKKISEELATLTKINSIENKKDNSNLLSVQAINKKNFKPNQNLIINKDLLQGKKNFKSTNLTTNIGSFNSIFENNIKKKEDINLEDILGNIMEKKK